MGNLLQVGGVRIALRREDIRNLHLGVYPPDGAVRIAAPAWMDEEAIRLFAIGKLGWIRRQQKKLREQEREPARDYVERESHYVWGRRYLLHVVERDAAPAVALRHRHLELGVRPGATRNQREAVVSAWYRAQIRAAVPALLERWEPLVGQAPRAVFVQHMKTRWGGCNVASRNIRLNTELAKKPPECLEYVLLHELVHLREATHNARFVALMDRLMPRWRDRRALLNRLPIAVEQRPRCVSAWEEPLSKLMPTGS